MWCGMQDVCVCSAWYALFVLCVLYSVHLQVVCVVCICDAGGMLNVVCRVLCVSVRVCVIPVFELQLSQAQCGSGLRHFTL